jgi:hypothetical protein
MCFTAHFDELAAPRVARVFVNQPPPQTPKSLDLLANVSGIASIAASAASVGLTTVAIYDHVTRRLITAPLHSKWASMLRNLECRAKRMFPSDMDKTMRMNQQNTVAFYSIHRPNKTFLFMDPDAMRWIQYWGAKDCSGKARATKRSARAIVEQARVSGRIDASGGISCMPWLELMTMTTEQGCVCGAPAHRTCQSQGCTRKYCST